MINKNVLVSKSDVDGNIIEISEQLCKTSMYLEDELLGQNHSILRHPDMHSDIFQDMWQTITKGKTWQGEIKNKKKDGSFYWVDTIINCDCDLNGNIIGYTAIRHDITDKKRIEQISITDGLTSLYNRRHFDEIFPSQLELAKRTNLFLAFVIMDIDHFKQYNDTYGHQAGDKTLKLVAKALGDTLQRPNDFSFRLGGEEFGLLYFIQNKEDGLNIANQARVNIEQLHIEHTGNSASKYVTISSGLYMIDNDTNSTIEDIYNQADEALYKAKQSGRNKICKVG